MDRVRYDLAFSLGGNCAVASQLRQRGLRPYSLPFDWVYMLKDTYEVTLNRLACCFEDDFKNFFLEENIKPLPEGLNRSHEDRPQYYDSYTEYRFVNHFDLPMEKGGYPPVKIKLTRRIDRLVKAINKGRRILLILATPFEIKLDAILYLKGVLERKWPGKVFDFKVVMFNCVGEESGAFHNILVDRHIRLMNDNDFGGTNPEWNFMNNLSLSRGFFWCLFCKKMLINLIPYRPLRKKLRNKFHIYTIS